MGQGRPGPKFEAFVRDYGEKAFQFAYRLSGNVEDAKGLVQEAFYRVLRSWSRYDEDRSLDAWFRTILRHVFLDGRKRYERKHVVSLDKPVGSVEDEVTTYKDLIEDKEESVIERLERAESAELVHKTLEEMSYGHRVVLTLCDMEGMSYDEISQILDVPVGTVRSRISRARTAFRFRIASRIEQSL